jgi:hypothetical protein
MGLRTFAELIAELSPAFLSELNDEIGVAIDDIADTDKGVSSATVSVSIAIKRSAKGRIEFAPSHKMTMKRASHTPSAFYVAPNGELVDEDPTQQRLPFDEKVRPIKKEHLS